jgi:hypothetical protein
MKFPRCFINRSRSAFIRIRRPFKVKANSGTLFIKHGADRCLQLDCSQAISGAILSSTGRPIGHVVSSLC